MKINISFYLILFCAVTRAPMPELNYSVMVPQYVAPESIDTQRLMQLELDYLKAKIAKYSAAGKAVKNYNHSDIVEDAVQEVDYKISPSGKRGAVKSCYTPKYKETAVPGEVEPIIPPVAVGGLPVVAPPAAVPINTDKFSPVGLTADNSTAEAFITLFKTQAFFDPTDSAAAENLFGQKMMMTLLQNRAKSVFSVKNQSLKVKAANRDEVVILKAAWSPLWWLGLPYFTDVMYQDVRKYLRNCLMQWDKAARDKKEQWVKAVQKIVDQEKLVAGQVPYRQLRELLRQSQDTARLWNDRLQLRPNLRIFACIHDSDITALRWPNGVGLYKHYEKLFAQHYLQNNRLPDLASTGYFGEEEQVRNQAAFGATNAALYYALIRQSISKDRTARAHVAQVDYRAIYWPEPNLLILMDAGANQLNMSFLGGSVLGRHNDDDNKESVVIVRALAARGNVQALFDSSYPVIMKLPKRMLEDRSEALKKFRKKLPNLAFDPTTRKFTNFNRALIEQFDGGMPQQSFDARNHALATLYDQFGIKGGSFQYLPPAPVVGGPIRPNDFFVSAYSGLFKHVVYGKTLVINSSGNNDALEAKLQNITLADLVQVLNGIFGNNLGTILHNVAKAFKAAYDFHNNAYF